MSSIDWVPELARALDEIVPLEDGARADWEDIVARVDRRRRLRLWHGRPRRRLRLAIVVALLLLLLAGVATATYLLVRGDGRIALGGGQVPLLVTDPSGHGLHLIARCPVTRPSCEIDAPTWSPDGTQLAFLRGHIVGRLVTSRMSLYVAATKGTGPRRVARWDGCGDRLGGRLAWSPDSKWIAFSRAKRTGRRRLIWSI